MEPAVKTLFKRALADDLKSRVARLGTNPPALWGTMSAAQAAAHCADALEVASGDRHMPAGRLFGWLIKPLAIGDDTPMRKNSPTTPDLVIKDERDLQRECARLSVQIERFVTAGPSGCTPHPHQFFGRLTPEQWANLQYKHVDHHLRQFGA